MNNTKLNHLTIKLLKKLGNNKPTDEHVLLLSKLITTVSVQQDLSYDHKLTEREISCLYLAAKGLTSCQTAELMGVKTTTVVTHKRNILRKLSCDTFSQAIFEGICFNYIKPRTEI